MPVTVLEVVSLKTHLPTIDHYLLLWIILKTAGAEGLRYYQAVKLHFGQFTQDNVHRDFT